MSIRRWSVAIVFCVAVFAALAGFKVMEIKSAIAFAESFPEPSETVEVSHAQPMDYQKTIRVMGTTMATQSVALRNELPGTITSVNFESGKVVQKGQILIQLDVSQEQANLKAAEAQVNLAKSVHKRAVNLYKSKAVSREQLDTAIADLAAREAEVEALKSSIRKKTIRAPFDGMAGIHQFEVGQFLPDNSIVTQLVGNTGQMWVDFNVPQFYPALTVGSPIAIERISTQQTPELAVGKLIAEDTAIKADSRSRFYRAVVETENFKLSPNAAVSVEVPVTEPTKILAVAAPGVLQDNLGQYVYRLEPNENGEGFRAKRIKVTVVAKKNGFAFVSEGLREDDRIAGAGAFKLSEGLLVFTGERRDLSSPATAQSNSNNENNEGAL